MYIYNWDADCPNKYEVSCFQVSLNLSKEPCATCPWRDANKCMKEGTEAWDSKGPHSRVFKQIVELGANTNIIWKSFCHQLWVYIYLLFVVIAVA